MIGEQKEIYLYSRFHHFLLACGNNHEKYSFTTGIVKNLEKILTFDKARIYYLNENGNIVDQYLYRTSKKDVDAYFEYYSTLSDNYNIRISARNWPEERMYGEGFTIPVRDWKYIRGDSFICEYVWPLGIRHSLGFVLYDTDRMPRSLYMIDKCSAPDFNRDGIQILSMALPHLNNLHKNFFCPRSEPKPELPENDPGKNLLTKREQEIASMLCRDITPANISEKLHVTRATVYKHTHHIYEKLSVTNRQELMIKLMNSQP